ncbi:MAG TPA: flavoprotein, partial [Chthoniobacterales bacterium]|nr:flavoprotein [Chthoniobacterales bacterium]
MPANPKSKSRNQKSVVLGVTGSIAAYKSAELASLLVKQHHNVFVVMTADAAEFITP